jgi:hypothetical protein
MNQFLNEMTMKKIIISCLFSLATVYTFGQDVCWYFQGQKTCYEVSATRMLVKSETLDIAGLEDALQNPIAGSLKTIYVMDGGLFVVEMEHTNKEDMWALQRQVSSREDIIYTSPVFGKYPGSGYTNEVLVSLKSNDDYPFLLEYAKAYHIKDISPTESLLPETYMLLLPHNPEKDAAETAVELYETGLVLYSEPNFISLCPFEWCPFEPEGNMNTILEEEQRIACYPNPVSDILYVDTGKRTCDIRLYNSLGNMCRQVKATGRRMELSVSDLPDGLYFLTVYVENASKPETHKIIVIH